MDPILIAVIDTEEEFDWHAGFDRNATSVSAINEVWRTQDVFDEFGIHAVYVADYPVMSTDVSCSVMRDLQNHDAVEIGIQLHPWVSPPHHEAVNDYYSYQRNLDPELERKKLQALIEVTEANLGQRPRIHKAGRYGFGPNTCNALLSLGIETDLSVAPGYDFSHDGGPDFSAIDSHLYWLGRNSQLFGIPNAGGYMGPLKRRAAHLFGARAQSSAVGRLTSRLLSRSHLAERVLLSPEGHSFDKLKRLTYTLLRDGVRVFAFSLHSTSLRPGLTPYADTAAQVLKILDRTRRYFEFFRDELGGNSTGTQGIRALADEATSNA